ANGGVSFVAGVVGSAFSFDGVDDYVEVADAANLDLSDFTFELWINPAAQQVLYADVLRKEDHLLANNGYGLEMSNVTDSNDYFAGWKNGANPSVASQCWEQQPVHLTPNVWQHVAVVKSGATRSTYVNNVLVSTCTASDPSIAPSSAPLQIGTWIANDFRFWH